MRLDDYVFYKAYIFAELVSKQSRSDSLGVFVVAVLEMFTIFSVLMYYKVFLNPQTLVLKEKLTYIIVGGLIMIPNGYHYFRKDYY